MKNRLIFLFLPLVFAMSCNKDNSSADAYGNFEANETTISAETSGRLLLCNIEEGDIVEVGEYVGQIDSLSLYLQKRKLLAQQSVVNSKFPTILAQVEIFEEQIRTLQIEKNRVIKLLEDKAATQKQLDDINGQISIIEKHIEGVKSQNAPIFAELEVLNASIAIVDEQIKKTTVINPVRGTVINKFVEESEIVVPGRSMYIVANLEEIILRAFVSETQLNKVKIGDVVRIGVDASVDKLEFFEGTVYWVSDKAEFTPKIIQTREERVNLVYAIKIKVKNDGTLKIGMPAEVYFK